MYLDFYGLSASPFEIKPAPRYMYYSRRHLEALEHVLFGLQQRKGFIQLTGQVGTGKTTLCRALLHELKDGWATAVILNPVMSSTQLLRAILQELGLDSNGNDRLRLLERLNQFLLARAAAAENVALFVDEAQDLSDALLEELRLLSNLETDDRKLLQIVLVGQPELRQRLARSELRQLGQRILVRYHLEPLNRAETRSYIAHRLAVAGANGRPTFTTPALWLLHHYSRGLPRLINALCDTTLLAGYAEGCEALGVRHVRRAARALAGRDR